MVSEALKVISADEVSKHRTRADIWITIHGKVYDVSDFIEEHPGGPEVLLEHAGEDASLAFDDVGHSDQAKELLRNFLIGCIAGGNEANRLRVEPQASNHTPPQSVQSPSPMSNLLNSKWLLLTIGGAIIAGLLAYHYTSR